MKLLLFLLYQSDLLFEVIFILGTQEGQMGVCQTPPGMQVRFHACWSLSLRKKMDELAQE
jgi:hypothetical protein